MDCHVAVVFLGDGESGFQSGMPAGRLCPHCALPPAGGACQQCSQGRTYPNAVIPANLETVRIVPVPQTFSLGACTAACCDLPSCDLAWWFEGRCFLVSCPQEENCAPQKTGPLRSYLVFVLRPEGRPAPLLDYGERMLSRAAAAGAWGDPAEGTREDLPLGGQGQGRGMEGMAGMAEPSDDDGEMEPSLLQPSPKQGPSGSAEPAAWSLQPGGDGHSPAASSEKPRDPERPSRKDSAGSASPEHSPDSGDPPPSAATPPPGRALGKGAASLGARGDSGREVGVRRALRGARGGCARGARWVCAEQAARVAGPLSRHLPGLEQKK